MCGRITPDWIENSTDRDGRLSGPLRPSAGHVPVRSGRTGRASPDDDLIELQLDLGLDGRAGPMAAGLSDALSADGPACRTRCLSGSVAVLQPRVKQSQSAVDVERRADAVERQPQLDERDGDRRPHAGDDRLRA